MQLCELDEPLFAALLARWKRRYHRKRQRWQDRALFRSLNMALSGRPIARRQGTDLLRSWPCRGLVGLSL